MMLDLSQLADGASGDAHSIWRGPLLASHSNDCADGLEDVARLVLHVAGTAGAPEDWSLGAASIGEGRRPGRDHRLGGREMRG